MKGNTSLNYLPPNRETPSSGSEKPLAKLQELVLIFTGQAKKVTCKRTELWKPICDIDSQDIQSEVSNVSCAVKFELKDCKMCNWKSICQASYVGQESKADCCWGWKYTVGIDEKYYDYK